MSQPPLSDSERQYLETLSKLPFSLRSRLLGWAFELIPSIGFFAYGLFKDSRFFLVLGFISLLYFAVWRMYQQLRGSRMIHGIYQKRLAEPGSPDA
jgi:hypothetical protein